MAQPATIDTDLAGLQGLWQLEQYVVDGKAVPPGEVAQRTLETRGDYFRFPDAGRSGRFILNPEMHPKQIESLSVEGPEQGQVILGIYEISGELLRLCWGPLGGPRPDGFESTPGSGRTMQVWRKTGT